LTVMEEWVGADKFYLCPILDSYGILCMNLDRFKEAEDLLLRSLRLKQETYGLDHYETARSYTYFGNLLRKQNRLDEAKNYYKQSISVWEKLNFIAEFNSEISFHLLNLGEISFSEGDYLEAEKYILSGLEFLHQAVQDNHYLTAPFFSTLAAIYYEKREYLKSLDYHYKAFDIWNQYYGEKHPQTITTLKYIAMNLKALGEFEKAANVYTRFIDLWGKIYVLDDPMMVPVFTDLATVYERLRTFEKAEMNYQKALKINYVCLGADHIEVAKSMENLGNLYLTTVNTDQAEDFYDQARNILLRLKSSNKNVSSLLVRNYLAAINLYKSTAQYKNVEKCYKKIVNEIESTVYPDPETTAMALGNLGIYYHDNHNYVKAGEYFNQALQIRRNNIAVEHPGDVWLLLSNAALQIVQKNYPGAISYFRQIFSIQDKYTGMIFSFAKEEEKVNFIDNLNAAYSAYLSFITKSFSKDEKVLCFSLETVFKRKGLVIDAESSTIEAILPLLHDEEPRKTWITRGNKLSRLSQLTLGNPRVVNANALNHNEEISTLLKEIAELEMTLKKSSPIAAHALPSNITVKSVCDAMPKNSVLLEFVKIRDFDFENIQDPWGLIRYIAFVLNSDGSIKLIDIGRAFDIEQTITAAIRCIREELEGTEKILKQLYTRLWSPLEKSLEGIDQVIISPDSMLNLVPFAALINESGSPLVEQFTITHVNSGREIIDKIENVPDNKYMLIFADADHECSEIIPLRTILNPEKEESTFWFKALPMASQEANTIPSLIPLNPEQIKIFLKDRASKTALLNSKNPWILHIAAHGFSLPDHIDQYFPVLNGLSRGYRSLERMGVALAGANQSNIDTENVSGLLSIMEITGLELHETGLLVLSSSNPGKGEFLTAEGIFAFKRAFVKAGVKNLVMNLWPVNEKYRLLHMNEFYKNLSHMPPAEALRQTQLQIIEDLKKSEGYAAPNLWAPFFIQGSEALTLQLFS
ncbi:MAG: CHAT domain-containing protein, partial [Acidobacteria bacterium]|nr:CHAT domain-containing protein [Acidobacteriota bacterium]